MKNNFFFIIAVVLVIICPLSNVAQAPYLGTAANFVLFTTTGAVGNTGTSLITGNIGTGNGAITGFMPPSMITGTINSGNAVTVQCAIDVQSAYNQLFNTAPTHTDHAPAFGTGETVFAGVYAVGGAGSIAGNLTLDAQGNSNAIFIFKFGGAFTTGASTTISLINGAAACNIFWCSEGAIAMAALTDIKGTLIANNGAISMGANGSIEGRMLSTTGEASVYAVTMALPFCSILPIELISFTAECDTKNINLNWSTSAEINNNYFSVERSTEGINWQVMGTTVGAGNSNSLRTYSFTDKQNNNNITFYRLKQTNFNGSYKYGKIISVKNCEPNATDILTIYPNPTNGTFELFFNGDKSQVKSIEILNSTGHKIFGSTGFQSKFDLGIKTPGIYFIKVFMHSKVLSLKILLQ